MKHLRLVLRAFALAFLFLPIDLFPAIPPLHFHAAAQYAGTARRLAATSPLQIEALMRLAGSTSLQPIDVTLADTHSTLADVAPPWASGYAIGDASVVVLFPSRNPTYPDDSLEETFLHELTHIFIARASRGKPVPRWFNEGVAVVAGRSWTLEDQARFSYAGMLGSHTSPEELDRAFQGDAGSASRAYVVSEAFVRDVIRTHGGSSIADILREVGAGTPFRRAFFDSTTWTPERAFERFWEQQGWRRNLIPLLTSSALLWLIITSIGISAIRRRRQKDELKKESWELEEQMAFEEEILDEEEPVN